MTVPQLFSPLTTRSLTLKNRIAVSPMCMYSAIDGVPQDWHMVHLGSRAVGGAGLVMAEATAVTPAGRISPGDTGIWNESQQSAWAPIAKFIQDQGSAPAIQLAHAGRKASANVSWRGGPRMLGLDNGGWTVVGPSAIPFSDGDPMPHALTVSEIEELVQQFGEATDRSHAAGFQVVEIHAAHGYLLHEFLSPLSNHRTDTFGGSLENRMSFPLMVATEVRRRFPKDLPVWVRISATDWADGGWDLDQSVIFCQELKKIGIDLIDVSSGALIPHAKIPVAPGFQVPLAARIRKDAGIMTGAVGLVTEPQQAEAILQEGQADIVLLARQLLRDPYWPLHAAKSLGADVTWPLQYQRAKS